MCSAINKLNRKLSKMENPVVVITSLVGAVGGRVKHTIKQRHTCQVDGGSVSRMIRHTDRPIIECVRRTNVGADVVSFWTSETCPAWENPKRWKSMSERQRLISHVVRFDEGHGVTFEIIK